MSPSNNYSFASQLNYSPARVPRCRGRLFFELLREQPNDVGYVEQPDRPAFAVHDGQFADFRSAMMATASDIIEP